MTYRFSRITATADGITSTSIQDAIYAQVGLSDEDIGKIAEATIAVCNLIDQSIIDYQL